MNKKYLIRTFLSCLIVVIITFSIYYKRSTQLEVAGHAESSSLAVELSTHTDDQVSADKNNNPLIKTAANGSSAVSFLANPETPLTRGANKRLLFQDPIITERRFKPESQFEGNVFTALAGKPKGSLTYNDITKSAIEADFDLVEVERFLASDAEYLAVPISADEEALFSVTTIYDRGAHTVSLTGTIKGQGLSSAALVFHDGAVSGTFELYDDGRIINYGMSGAGSIAIRELDSSKVHSGLCDSCDAVEHGVTSAVLDSIESSIHPESYYVSDELIQNASYPEGAHVSDVLFRYFPTVAETLGGTAAAEAKMVEAVDSINIAITNSRIDDVYVVLVATEASYSGSLSLLELLGADLLARAVDDTTRGIANYIAGWEETDDTVIPVIEIPSIFLTGAAGTTTHEFGHISGCFHAWGDSGASVRNTAHGWRFIGEDDRRYRTVMAYNSRVTDSATRIGYFSSPTQLYEGVAMGAELGFDGTADPTVDQSLVYGGGSGSLTDGYNETNTDLAADNQSSIHLHKALIPAKNVRTSAAILEPSGGETYYLGEVIPVFWLGGDYETPMTIDLYKSDTLIANAYTNSSSLMGSYEVTVPYVGGEGSDYNVRMTIGDIELQTANFTIVEVPPVAYWPMDETTGSVVADATGNGNDAAGTPENRVQGKLAGAFKFNAASVGITAPSSLLSGITDELSLSMWVLGNDSQPHNESLLTATNVQGATLLNIKIPNADSEVVWLAGNDSASATSDTDVIRKTATITDFKEQWNHWVFTKNSSAETMEIYLNGNLWHSETSKAYTLINGSPNDIIIGEEYRGNIDEVAFFDRALNSDQVKSLFNSVSANNYPIANGFFTLPNVSIAFEASDPDSDDLTYDIVTPPAHGTMTGTASNWVYIPDVGAPDQDRFTYTANDGQDRSSVATVVIDNRASETDGETVIAETNGFKSITLTSTSSPASYTVVLNPIHGVLTGTAPDLIYTPNTDYYGIDSFTYYVSDDDGDSEIISVWINVFVPITTTTTTSSTMPTVSTDDLAQTHYLNSSATGGNEVATQHAELFNGVVGNADNNTTELGEVMMDSGNTITVEFDLSTNIHGYDLTGITSVFGWDEGAGGRSNQGYELIVTYVDDTTATLAGPEEWEPNDPSFYWTTVSFVREGGILTSGVKSVTFDITEDAPPGGVVVAREIDIFGVPSSGYTAWWGSYSALTDVSITGDPEGDGIENLLEYVLDGDPTAVDTLILPELDATGENFVFTFTRLASSAVGMTQVFQYSSTLESDDWTDLSITDPKAAEVTIGTPVNGLETVTVTISKSLAVGDKLFGHLKVTIL